MTARNYFMDEISKLMTDAAGAAQGMRREAQTLARFQIDKVLAEMDLVRREEFDAVREMATLARRENDALAARLAALEAKLAGETPVAAPAKAASSPAAAKDTAPTKSAPKARSAKVGVAKAGAASKSPRSARS